jgi:hypothetical protein
MIDLYWALGFLLILYKDGRRCVTVGVVGEFSSSDPCLLPFPYCHRVVGRGHAGKPSLGPEGPDTGARR